MIQYCRLDRLLGWAAVAPFLGKFLLHFISLANLPSLARPSSVSGYLSKILRKRQRSKCIFYECVSLVYVPLWGLVYTMPTPARW